MGPVHVNSLTFPTIFWSWFSCIDRKAISPCGFSWICRNTKQMSARLKQINSSYFQKHTHQKCTNYVYFGVQITLSTPLWSCFCASTEKRSRCAVTRVCHDTKQMLKWLKQINSTDLQKHKHQGWMNFIFWCANHTVNSKSSGCGCRITNFTLKLSTMLERIGDVCLLDSRWNTPRQPEDGWRRKLLQKFFFFLICRIIRFFHRGLNNWRHYSCLFTAV